MTNTPDLTLPHLTALADVLRNATNLLETTARRRAAPAVDPAPRKRAKGMPARGSSECNGVRRHALIKSSSWRMSCAASSTALCRHSAARVDARLDSVQSQRDVFQSDGSRCRYVAWEKDRCRSRDSDQPRPKSDPIKRTTPNAALIT